MLETTDITVLEKITATYHTFSSTPTTAKKQKLGTWARNSELFIATLRPRGAGILARSNLPDCDRFALTDG